MVVHVPGPEAAKLAFAILRRLFPFSPQSGPQAPTLEALRKKYQRWEIFSTVLFLLVLPLAVYGWMRLFELAAQAFARQHQPTVFFLMLESPWFWIPALFLGIVSTTPLLYGVMNLLLQDRYPEYVYYGNLKTGFDTTKSFGVCALVMATLSLCLGLALMDQYTYFTPGFMAIKHLWRAEEVHYPYAQVVAIHYLKQTYDHQGESNHDPQYRVCFADGTLWRFQTYRETTTPEALALEKSMIHYIARQSHQRIQVVEDPHASPYDTRCQLSGT